MLFFCFLELLTSIIFTPHISKWCLHEWSLKVLLCQQSNSSFRMPQLGECWLSHANCRPSLHLIPYFVSGRNRILQNVQTSVQWSVEIWDETRKRASADGGGRFTFPTNTPDQCWSKAGVDDLPALAVLWLKGETLLTSSSSSPFSSRLQNVFGPVLLSKVWLQ